MLHQTEESPGAFCIKKREQTHSQKNLLTLLRKLISLLEQSELADASRKCLRRHIRKKNCKFFLLELSSIKVMELCKTDLFSC